MSVLHHHQTNKKIHFPIFEKGQVETECPAGTKCVQDFFCNENAVMVNYRVNLTPAQKQKRGDLIVNIFDPKNWQNLAKFFL